MDWNAFFESGCFFSPPIAKGAGCREIWLGWGSPLRSERQTSTDQFCVYAPDFFLKNKNPWWTPPFFKKVTFDSFMQTMEDVPPFKVPRESWTGANFSAFSKSFYHLQSLFLKGSLNKGVPIVLDETTFRMSPDSIRSAFHRLLFYSKAWPFYLYGIWDLNEGILGATPEFLFKMSTIQTKQVILTMALAGTRPRIKTLNSSALLSDPKERREHQLVIDGIQSSLQSLGLVHVGETDELELPTLFHLMTPLSLIPYDGVNISTDLLVELLHPTPALGVHPKTEGAQWLREHQERFRFGAPFGVCLPKQGFQCLVAIRNIQWVVDQLYIGAGAGVIAESQLEKEWAEIQSKILAVKEMFGI